MDSTSRKQLSGLTEVAANPLSSKTQVHCGFPYCDDEHCLFPPREGGAVKVGDTWMWKQPVFRCPKASLPTDRDVYKEEKELTKEEEDDKRRGLRLVTGGTDSTIPPRDWLSKYVGQTILVRVKESSYELAEYEVREKVDGAIRLKFIHPDGGYSNHWVDPLLFSIDYQLFGVIDE